MIRNLIILDNVGHTLLSASFGECHSMGDDASLVSGFISALHSFSKMLSAGDLSEIQLGTLSFLLMTQDDLLFAVSADDDKSKANRAKLQKIVELFTERYPALEEFREKTGEFTDYLLERHILERNCGEHEDCIDCPNRDKSLPLSKMQEGLGQSAP